MKRVIPIVMLAAAVSGCATSSMKSTPFYCGSERVYTGRVEDRVNLWPIAYYREPALSVAWPIFSLTDDHLAIRPIYSQYRQDGKNAGYDEFNFVWPLCQFDTKHDQHRIFPLFWGDKHVDLFPLVWWRFNKSFTLFPLVWWKDDRYFNVFPLWWSDNSRKLFLPFYYQDENTLNILPFYGKTSHLNSVTEWYGPYGRHRDEKSPEQNCDWCFPFYYRDATSFETPLFGWDRNDRSSWAFPLYYKDRESFVSLPWISGQDKDSSWWIVPPLLSGGGSDKTGTFNTYLLGLAGNSTDADGHSKQHVFPLFFRDDDMLATPIFGMNRRTGGSWLFPCYYEDDDMFLSAFYWRKWSTDDRGERTLSHGSFPFWQSDDAGFDSLFWISHHDRSTNEDFWCVPPLLSWGTSDRDEWTQRYLFGLCGREGKGSDTTSWLFPLYYSDKDRFVTPLYGQTAKSNWCVPLWYKDDKSLLTLPYCTWWKENGDWEGSFVLPALTYFGADGDFASLLWGKAGRENWLAPLWWKDERKFASLLWYWDWGDDSDTYVVPPLLSWVKSSSKGNKKMRFLLGLGGVNTTGDGEDDCSWAFPLYYNDGRSFISLLFGHEKDYFTYVTPLFGVTHTEHKKGAWLWPLFGWTSDDRMETVEAMLNAPTLDPKLKLEKHESEWGGKKHQWHTIKGVDSYVSDSSWRLSGLSTSDRTISWSATDDGKVVTAEDESDFGNFFAYKSENSRTVKFDAKTREKLSDEENGESGLLCNFFWHSKHEASKGHEYDMKSILWRFWHYEKLNGDVTVDSFPFFTYDSKTNGYSKTSLCWRLFRNEYDPKTDKRSVDFLFVPVWR